MVRQHDVRPPRGARRPARRYGRGNGSGRGNYSGRGVKGQQARSGPGPKPGFEGGQLPLVKGLPTRRGFTNIFATVYEVVNLGALEERFDPGEPVTPERMVQAGLLRRPRLPVKVLAKGELAKPLAVVAHRFSAKAREMLEAAGGSAEEIKRPAPRPRGQGKGRNAG